MKNDSSNPVLERIANALERLAPKTPILEEKMDSNAYVWDTELNQLKSVENVSRLDLTLLKGLEQQIQILYDNTKQFAQGLPANNALLWGARGTGKSSLIKAIHGDLNENTKFSVILVEIFREDINSLPALLDKLKNNKKRFILFCDDLSFEDKDTEFKSLKAVLEGGIEGRPDNVIFYATSNRRHLMPRDMIENERSSAIHTSESVEEKVSLSDRFGLWLGFHPINQETYFEIVDSYAKTYKLAIDQTELRSQALEWSMTRGSRSGRVAWQFIQDLAGKQGKKLTNGA